MSDWYSNIGGTYGLGNAGMPADWAPEPAQVTVNPAAPNAAPGAADAYARQGGGPPPPAAPPPPPTSGLGSWFGLLGGGGAAPAAPQAGTAPGWQQGAVGLGLGLLSGNPFNKWGKALEGYQRGAAADVARQQLANTYGYQQQSLAQTAQLQREHMQLQRELAYKPQVQFRQNEETGEWEALQYDPRSGSVKNVPIEQAGKIAGQQGVPSTWEHPLTKQQMPFPPGIDTPRAKKEFLRKIADVQADIAAGKTTWWQWLQQQYYGTQPSSGSKVEPGKTIGERKQFKQGWGVWNGNAWIKER